MVLHTFASTESNINVAMLLLRVRDEVVPTYPPTGLVKYFCHMLDNFGKQKTNFFEGSSSTGRPF